MCLQTNELLYLTNMYIDTPKGGAPVRSVQLALEMKT